MRFSEASYRMCCCAPDARAGASISLVSQEVQTGRCGGE